MRSLASRRRRLEWWSCGSSTGERQAKGQEARWVTDRRNQLSGLEPGGNGGGPSKKATLSSTATKIINHRFRWFAHHFGRQRPGCWVLCLKAANLSNAMVIGLLPYKGITKWTKCLTPFTSKIWGLWGQGGDEDFDAVVDRSCRPFGVEDLSNPPGGGWRQATRLVELQIGGLNCQGSSQETMRGGAIWAPFGCGWLPLWALWSYVQKGCCRKIVGSMIIRVFAISIAFVKNADGVTRRCWCAS